MKVAYWRDHHNFGDVLTPYLLEHFLGLETDNPLEPHVWYRASNAKIVEMGNNLLKALAKI